MKDAPSNSDNVIDSRDIIKRIEELQEEREGLVDMVAECRDAVEAIDDTGEDRGNAVQALADAEETLRLWDEEEEGQELKALSDLADEASSSPDWTYGETLIRDSYFKEYAMELAEEIGAIGENLDWPACHIDWDAAADALKQDYTSVDFDGVDYWIRS